MKYNNILWLFYILTTLMCYGQPIEERIDSKSFPSDEWPIGKTEGQLEVGPTGGALYTIPLQVAKGVNALTPQLSFVYNSQAGNGVVGLGWAVAGVSTINRIASTQYHDGEISGVNFSETDRFTLDGQRLLLKSGTYGGDGAEYQTERYSNLKITSHGVSPYGVKYGPAYFKVQHPDGSISLYGATADSRSKLAFAISSTQDPSKNKIVYHYIERGGMQLISSIQYVSRIRDFLPTIEEGDLQQFSTTLDPIYAAYENEIEFVYQTLEAGQQTFYVGGEKFENLDYLSQIEVKSEGVLFRRYFLDYLTTPLHFKLLKSIKEYNGFDTKELQPILLSYKEESESENTTVLQREIPTNLQGDVTANKFGAISGDFDGDGSLDYLVYKKDRKEYWVYYSSAEQEGTYAHHNVGTGAVFDAVYPIQLKSTTNEVLSYEGWLEISGYVFQARSLMDGMIKSEFTRSYNFPRFKIQPTPENCHQSYDFTLPNDYYSGDFNGDGLTDILAIQKPADFRIPNCTTQSISYEEINLPGGDAYLLDLNENTTQPTDSGFIRDYKEDTKVVTGNFLGSSKTDVLVMNDTKMTLYTYTGTAFTQVFDYENTHIRIGNQVHVGDFNGDGKTDVMLSAEGGANWIFYCTGTGFERVEVKGGFYTFKDYVTTDHYNNNFPVLEYVNHIAADFNNDGKTDMIEFRYFVVPKDHEGFKKGGTLFMIDFVKNEGNSVFNTAAVIDAYSTDSVFKPIQSEDEAIQYIPIPIYLSPFSKVAYTTNSFRMGLFINQGMYTFEYRYNQAKNRLITSIQQGDDTYHLTYGQYGVKNENPEDQTDFPSFMKYSTVKEKYPLIEPNTLLNTYLVTSIQVTNNQATALKQTFAYASPVIDLQGLGFLGFKGVVRTNWYDTTENMFKKIQEMEVQNRGLLKRESVITGNQWQAFIEEPSPSGITAVKAYETITNYTYHTQVTADKVFIPQLTKVVNQVMEGMAIADSFIKETTNTYNAFNDIVQESSVYKRNLAVAKPSGPRTITDKTETTAITYAYSNDTEANYFRSRITASKQTQIRTGEEEFTTEERYGYDDKGRVILAIKKGNNTSDSIVEKNRYDTYGNVVEKIVKAGDLPERKQGYKYGYFGRFLTEETDVEGLKTTYKYQSFRGLLTETTDVFGRTTTYTYNNWGQPTGVTNFLGKTTQTEYVKTDQGFEITTQDGEGGWQRETYDTRGNKTQSAFIDIRNDLVWKSFEYDVFNRLIKESEPYDRTILPLWNTIEYDKRGRVYKTTSSKDKTISTTYTVTTTKVDDGVSIKETRINSAGDVVTRKDAGGEINYAYFSNGNLKSTAYDGAVVSLEQDGWGRKTKLIDPSAGTYTYEYNALGELIKETTPKGITTITLDPVGKLIQKNTTGEQTNTQITYTYAEGSKLLDNITATVNDDRYTYDYVYDTLHRLIKTTETTPVATFIKQLTFNAFGREFEETIGVQTHGRTKETKISHQYKNGFHSEVVDVATGLKLITKVEANAYGQLTQIELGNGLKINNTYDAYGYLIRHKLKDFHSIDLYQLTNQFDVQRGNLLSRTNGMFNRTETFTYDQLDRVTSFTNREGIQETQEYDSKGRILSNEIGTYKYPSESSYQVASIDLNPEAHAYGQVHPTQQVLYNAFKKPVWIKEEGKENIYFDYNPLNQRSVMYHGDLAASKEQSPFRRYYSADGSIEVNYDIEADQIDLVFYLDGDAYSATVIAKMEKGDNRLVHHFFHRDYLGSILAISNARGELVEKRHFDAWGNLVIAEDGQGNERNRLTVLDRGFTGHEHLQGVSLVQMNGRLYDPTVHRFLAPDNFVQDITYTQNFNRYGYVWNNPLVYIDQDGELLFVPIIIAAVVGGVINWGIHGFKMDKDGLLAFGIGATGGAVAMLTGGVAFGLMGGAAGGALAGMGSGIIGTATQVGITSLGNSFYLGDPMISAKDFYTSVGFGGVLGGLSNGILALLNGRNFWTGAAPIAHPLPVTINPAGVVSQETEVNLSTATNAKSVPDLNYTNQVKNSTTKVVPLSVVDGGIQGGPLTIPNTVLDEITVGGGGKSTIATGQAHHLLGNRITRVLNNHPTLKNAFDYSRMNAKYIYKASDDASHRGYQTWHREYDATVVKWLQSNPSATPIQFDRYLHNLHQQPWLKNRIPNVNLIE
ncbi:RHS repeat-associated core domain-containing protein [Myroides sp. WP-1]|uniref:RHS repeat-associated core domain-containing protein n=1 Tax=Myroides sp. WP-1 TaxID=2759944 RepID=UPI0015FBBC67|nr:RHS repeat-associated core domain-containing protein [Myroides sp. WP-1]MBB1139132.1 FG-GAP repeat protein [Myroides sp. WP-1]